MLEVLARSGVVCKGESGAETIVTETEERRSERRLEKGRRRAALTASANNPCARSPERRPMSFS